MSYLRLEAGDVPAEFVVIADCGHQAPRGRYATVRVAVWPTEIAERYGDYGMSFAQAQRNLLEGAGLLPRSVVEVVTVRDPDRRNDYRVFIDGKARPDGASRLVRVVTHDIDLGASDITRAWVTAELDRAAALSPAAAAYARDIIAEYADDNAVDGP